MKTQDRDVKKRRRAALSKMAILLAFTVLVWLFLTAAWFAINKNVSGSGMGVRVGTDAYEIVPLGAEAAASQSKFQHFYDLIYGSSTNDAAIWTMTSDSKMDNLDEADEGIRPDSAGKIEFYVKPRDESVTLDLTFEFTGYAYTEEATDPTDHSVISTEAISRISGENGAVNNLQKYLSGHIFLFAEKETVNGKIKYSEPILSGSDLKMVWENKRVARADQNTPVTVYWVWPNTLSTIIDVRTGNDYVSIEPFCDTDTSMQIAQNIKEHPELYFYNNGTDNAEAFNSISEALNGDDLAEKIVTYYEDYAKIYDRVDNEIGKSVDYVTLKMTSAQSAGT